MATLVNMEKMVALLSSIRFTGETNADGTPRRRGMVRATIVKVSDPAPRKGDKGRIRKITTGNVDFNRDTPRLREENGLPPVGGPLPWGEWVAPGSPVIAHKGQFYFGCVPTTEGSAGAVGIVCDSRFESVDGTPLERDSELVQSICYRKVDGTPLAGYDEKGRKLRDHNPSDYGYRTFSLSTCSVKLTIDGETYEYTPN